VRERRVIRSRRHLQAAALCGLAIAGGDRAAKAQDAETAEPAEQRLAVHGQSTFVGQYHPPFRALYTGPLSLDPQSSEEETVSLSLFLGARLWQGAEVYANPELLQGFGLSNSTGIAGFTNGEAFKVGSRGFIPKMSRLFLRQTLALGRATDASEAGQTQLAGRRPVERITITLGKYAVVDIFDDNAYAHDSRAGFLNWTVNDAGAFDMASPAFNYTYGAAVEWYRAWWAVRGGLFLEPSFPNAVSIDTSFRQFQPLLELEERHGLRGEPGKLKLLLFGKRVNAGSFDRAVALSQAIGGTPSAALVRSGLVWSYGAGINLEQRLGADLGMFARASAQAGNYEEFSFTQVEEAILAGLVLSGAKWKRAGDAAGVAILVNGVFQRERTYLALGGTGIILGDGALRYGPEEIAEIYYKLSPWEWAALTADYQLVNHPAYNRDRGPVSVFGARIHVEF